MTAPALFSGPEFVREMRAAGHDQLSPDDPVSMRIHNVTTDFVRQIRELRFRDASVEELVSTRIHARD